LAVGISLPPLPLAQLYLGSWPDARQAALAYDAAARSLLLGNARLNFPDGPPADLLAEADGPEGSGSGAGDAEAAGALAAGRAGGVRPRADVGTSDVPSGASVRACFQH
jgi:hypothetical protein